ncbi:hypothetical protein A2686_04400 [Candidatus Woesebacteria bacterium RIFCSPHIGHO2_01_FULL_38_10]|uniref:Uncharacterized protein n=1 Tax=Candidatus Woesebacteria bacterium RIFCSPLOWO2_01_FULL_39_10b TaxID=1802517 RepID=A0A1F8B9Y0_9BACT|nr:MAG: hypothetical protein A2686_04400 [Candidatus Woesebacteria bacterium RIFCSPHIGHO2_01_FULL_38_10]OGM60852.1 MAG: hypothetical protein A2892_04325 [Candidatus Woesebacteria bacterium RIFCSPLOWO2_01_FULL_39_10b]
MRSKRKIKKIAFDLDGVFINKPPFIPRKVIEWLYRSHRNNKKLSYRMPTTKIERLIRSFSHHHLFRPPIKKNIEFAKK